MRPDVLYFHPSAKDVLPGRGRKEFVKNPATYADLAAIPDWRRALSVFHGRPVVSLDVIREDDDDGNGSPSSSTSSSSLDDWERIKMRILESSAERVCTFNPEARRVLELTGSAELWYGLPNKRPIRCHHLEKLRSVK